MSIASQFHRLVAAGCCIFAALSTACIGGGAEMPASTGTDRTSPPASFALAIDGHSNQFPSLASSGTTAAVAWAATDPSGVTDIYLATSTDAGSSFGMPVRVNHLPGDARANGEQPPRVALVPQSSGPPHVVVFWLSRRESGSVLLTSRSGDGGRHFEEATLVAGTDTSGNRGWHALDVAPGGDVRLAWLDHRRVAAAEGAVHSHTTGGGTTTPADPTDGAAMALQSDLYFAAAPDAGNPRPLTAGVCYCCKTAMAHGRDGAIHIAWRHVYPGNMRDIAFTTSRDGGRTFSEPVRVSEDHWAIAGCPDDGPSMAVDADARAHVVWPTAITAPDGTFQKRLFHAMTTDGRTFSPRIPLPVDDAAHHPQIAAMSDGTILVAWDGHIGDDAHVFRARGSLDANGTMQFARAEDGPWPGRYPAVVATSVGALTAWTTGTAAASTVHVAAEPSGPSGP